MRAIWPRPFGTTPPDQLFASDQKPSPGPTYVASTLCAAFAHTLARESRRKRIRIFGSPCQKSTTSLKPLFKSRPFVPQTKYSQIATGDKKNDCDATVFPSRHHRNTLNGKLNPAYSTEILTKTIVSGQLKQSRKTIRIKIFFCKASRERGLARPNLPTRLRTLQEEALSLRSIDA